MGAVRPKARLGSLHFDGGRRDQLVPGGVCCLRWRPRPPCVPRGALLRRGVGRRPRVHRGRPGGLAPALYNLPRAGAGWPPGGRLVPDFAAVARDWDAVHLTLGGLLTAEQVRVDGPGGATELQGWDAEQTVWLRWVFDEVTRLPDLLRPSP